MPDRTVRTNIPDPEFLAWDRFQSGLCRVRLNFRNSISQPDLPGNGLIGYRIANYYSAFCLLIPLSARRTML